MNIFQSIKNLFIQKEEVSGMENITTWDILQHGLDWRTALSIPAVWHAVNLLSADVAKVPIDVFRKTNDGRESDRSIAASVLLRESPNEAMTSYMFRRTLTAHAVLTGTGLAAIYRDISGAPKRLVVLPPPPQTTVELRNGSPVWLTSVNGVTETFADSDVLAIRGLSRDGLMGISPLETLRSALLLELALQDHALAFFQKGLLLSGFLVSPRPLSPEEAAAIKASFASLYGGSRGQHGVAVLHGGIEWKPQVIDAEKSQLAEARQFGLRQVANIFGLPPHKLGDPSRTSYASLEQENADYLASSLDPWLVAWETECTKKLLRPIEQERGYYVEHNRNAYVRMSYADRVAGYAKLIEIGVMSPNEVRQKENMSTIPEGDRYYVPANWVPAS